MTDKTTTQQIQQEIIREFRGSSDWMRKYDRLIQLGKTLPAADKIRTENNLIKGCQVRTWYRSSFKSGKVVFEIDSLSLIVRGAIVLLLRVLDGRSPEEIKKTELYFIDKAGLRELFSPVKANSLWKLVNQINSDAAAYAANKR